MEAEKVTNRIFPKRGSFSAVVGDNKRRSFHLLVGASLTISTSVVGSFLTSSLTGEQSWGIRLGWLAAGFAVTFFYLRWQLRSQEESPEAIKERVSQLEPELRSQVQSRSYGARRDLIEAPLRELDLDITLRLEWVRDPRLLEPEPRSKQIADDIVAVFESSRRRLLIAGEPGSGKTMAAYSLIEYLDEREGDQRIPLLVNLSAWEAQDDFEAFLVDYLCSSVGYAVHERAVASAFISSDRYALILDGLDEIPVELRAHFSERLDEFVRGLPSEIAVVVTCRTKEYEELRKTYPEGEGLALVQAVEILPLTSEQLDSALAELAKFDDHDWESFLSQRHLTAGQRARGVLSNPLFLNLAVVGRLRPRQLLDSTTTEEELRVVILDSYLDRTIADQRHYEPEDARRYLSWIARFLNGAELSPFGLKETDFTVFDLADLTPPDPPRRYRFLGALATGLIVVLVMELLLGLFTLLGEAMLPRGKMPSMPPQQREGLEVLAAGPSFGEALVIGLAVGLIGALVGGWPYKRSAVSSRLTFVWTSTRQQYRDFFGRAGRGWVRGLGWGLVAGVVLGLVAGLGDWLYGYEVGYVVETVLFVLFFGLVLGLVGGLIGGLGWGLVKPRSVLITSRTPTEASSRSLVTALGWLILGLVGGALGMGLFWLILGLVRSPKGGLLVITLSFSLMFGLVGGLIGGLVGGLNNGGWFLLLQKVAYRRLARAGNLPSRSGDFLEWGIEKQIFRWVGGGVRFRHNLIQQHLASTSADAGK